jgi:hypothetical protein
MSWNEEELEARNDPYFFDHHDIPSRSRLMEINFRTSPEIKLPTTVLLAYLLQRSRISKSDPPCPTVRFGLDAMGIQVTQ